MDGLYAPSNTQETAITVIQEPERGHRMKIYRRLLLLAMFGLPLLSGCSDDPGPATFDNARFDNARWN